MVERHAVPLTHEQPHTEREALSDPRLLEILVCPVTGTTLRYDAAHQELISDAAKLAFPIRGGIPVMVPEEARSIEAP